MTLKKYILLMSSATVIAYLMLAMILSFFDPQSGILAIILFYISIAIAIVGTFSLLGLLFRVLFTRGTLMFKKVLASFRQSVLFAVLIVLSLILQQNDLLTPLTIVFLIGALTILELYFLTQKHHKRA